VPSILGTVVSRGFASFHELDTVYGTQDLFDMLEVISVDNHNQNLMNKRET
jgi:hypothetical protein